MKRVIALVVIAVGLAGVYALLGRSGADTAQRKPEEPRRNEPRTAQSAKTSRVAALGRLAPRNDVINVRAPAGERVSGVRVSDGQQVEAR